jgi:hypothetical protein
MYNQMKNLLSENYSTKTSQKLLEYISTMIIDFRNSIKILLLLYLNS